ncbi:MAG: hypothetical protein Q9207_003245 [Kuettlingeria erythrocarpa]
MREMAMTKWMNALTDLPDWERKIFDPDFIFEWKSAKLLTGHDVTRSMVEWCIEEVKYYVHDYAESHSVPAIDGGVLKSDHCIPTSTRLGLLHAVAAIKDQGGAEHAQVNAGARDLIDPYLFAYTWESSRTLRQGSVSRTDCITRCGDGEKVKMPPKDDCRQDNFGRYRNDMAWSRRYQWLPFDVRFTDGGRRSHYINDLHPIRHSIIYKQVETLTDQLIPLFNRTLMDLKAPGYHNQRIHLVCFGRDPFIDREPGPFRPPEQRAYSKYLTHDGGYQDWILVDLKREFWNTGIQMVLHIQEIDLTPDNPRYEGEEWHVQGQTNERVCATASYVYLTSNVASPTISFRRRVFPEEAIAAKGEIATPPFLPEIFGAKHGEPVIQNLGDVVLRENRVVVWPNVFQTKLDPVELQDQSRDGHLKILTLHLIDPNRRIMSTSMVPCQRRDWWGDAVRTSCPPLYRLPKEVFDNIIEMISEESYPVSMEEGKRIRKDFLEERDTYRKKHTEAMEGYDEWDFYGEPGVGDGDDAE